MSQPSHTATLISVLQQGATTAVNLQGSLGLSQPSISRVLRPLMAEGRVLRIGSTRGARYALRKEIAGIGSAWPLHRIDRTGKAHTLGTLYALAADEYYLEATQKAVAQGFQGAGLTSGLPYFLQDQRPGGFLGRAVPLRFPGLDLPQRIVDWSEEHYLRYLTQRGSDTVGDLILGKAAFDEYLSSSRRRMSLPAADRETRYPQLVSEVMSGGLPGSSAHGEHPKFAALIQDASGPRHVLVKFSPSTNTAVGRRWSDLLIAEHHAHRVLRTAGLPACQSRIFRFADRTYLEVERFDREGVNGRIGVTSLLAIDITRYRRLDNWIAAAIRLHDDRCIGDETLEQVRLAGTFGELIANTDRHFGNLAFLDDYDGRLQLAPVYDMLPMLFAPQHDDIIARTFDPPDPAVDTLPVWPQARSLAESYWRGLIEDARIGADFKAISAACLAALEAFPRTGVYA